MREALKLALEALIDLDALHHQDEPESVFAQKAITAIKAVLAEPVQEPVAIALNTGTKQGVKWLKNVEHGEKLYTTLPAQPAPTVQEPDELTIAYMSGLYDGKKHAVQREWVGLTDDEVNTLWGEWKDSVCLDHKTWAQAIEAKLKEKNT